MREELFLSLSFCFCLFVPVCLFVSLHLSLLSLSPLSLLSPFSLMSPSPSFAISSTALGFDAPTDGAVPTETADAMPAKLRDVFHQLDKDNSGYIETGAMMERERERLREKKKVEERRREKEESERKWRRTREKIKRRMIIYQALFFSEVCTVSL